MASTQVVTNEHEIVALCKFTISTSVVMVDTLKLSPHPRSVSNFGRPEARPDLLEAIKLADQILEPLVVTTKGDVILSGHTRWKCAAELDMKEVPVRYADVDPDSPEAALAVNLFNRHRKPVPMAEVRCATHYSNDYRRIINARGKKGREKVQEKIDVRAKVAESMGVGQKHAGDLLKVGDALRKKDLPEKDRQEIEKALETSVKKAVSLVEKKKATPVKKPIPRVVQAPSGQEIPAEWEDLFDVFDSDALDFGKDLLRAIGKLRDEFDRANKALEEIGVGRELLAKIANKKESKSPTGDDPVVNYRCPDIEALQKKLANCLPYGYCLNCDGRGYPDEETPTQHCATCRGSGWVNRQTYRQQLRSKEDLE